MGPRMAAAQWGARDDAGENPACSQYCKSGARGQNNRVNCNRRKQKQTAVDSITKAVVLQSFTSSDQESKRRYGVPGLHRNKRMAHEPTAPQSGRYELRRNG